MTSRKTGALAALLATLTVVVAVTAATAPAASSDPIVIGWAFDGKGNMAPFDGPALAAANVRVKQINAKGGVNGRKLRIITCDTQNNAPAKAKACAASLIGKGADIVFVTCDVDFATPVVAGGDQPRDPRGRTVHRHRPDGAEALRHEGQARLQLRQRRAGRGVGDGRVRVEAGLEDRRARHEHAARLLQERRPGVRGPVHPARREGRRAGELRDRCQQREHRRQPPERRQGGRDRDVDRVRRAARARVGSSLARQPDADPQLVGR